MGWDGTGWDGMGWKSLYALILRAPVCGANKGCRYFRPINMALDIGRVGQHYQAFGWGGVKWLKNYVWYTLEKTQLLTNWRNTTKSTILEYAIPPLLVRPSIKIASQTPHPTRLMKGWWFLNKKYNESGVSMEVDADEDQNVSSRAAVAGFPWKTI